MILDRPARRRTALRPRAGLAATALLIAGLAGASALALLGDFVEPATAQTVGSRIDQPTPATVPDAAHRGDTSVAPASALKPSTDVMETGSAPGERVDPKAHLPEATRRAD